MELLTIEDIFDCKDLESTKCAEEILKTINPNEKILLIGLQPRLLQSLSQRQSVRVIDLDQANIGQNKFGVTIESEDRTDEAIKWCDTLLVTGSTIVNGTIAKFINQKKPVIYFGVTISAAAKILGLNSYCAYGH
ncbi:MAG: hypothetical protein HQK51_21455 [Oligoflexia bacterium]|nr:hypothetical protein [Oligoflexia bacterium]